MTDNISKITKILLWVLIALSLFFALMLFVNTSETETSWIQNSLVFTYVILGIATVAAFVFSLYIFGMKLIAKPKNALGTLIPIILVAVIFLISYSSASSELLYMPNYDGLDNVPGKLKWSGAGLIMSYILLGFAVISIIVASIIKLFK